MKNTQYVYIGQYYHIKNKSLPIDFKFGVTDNLKERELSLSRTKSPIKYMIIDAWELPSSINREQVEKFISTIFDTEKYDGCEWYDINEEVFRGKISSIFNILTNMHKDENITFKKVDLNKESTTTSPIEKVIEEEIRTGKRGEWTNLSVIIEGIDVSGESGRDGFINAVKQIETKVGVVKLAIEFPNIFKLSPDDYPDYKKLRVFKIGKFYLDTHSSTEGKKKIIESMLDIFGIEGTISIK